MRFSTYTLPSTVYFMLSVFITTSIGSYGPAHPQLRHEGRRTIEKRTPFILLTSLFSKRDDCGTQFGPTYVDCGYDGCYQPSLGEICCGSEDTYCLVGTYCVGLNCCPNGLTPSCCGTGEGCPANVSDYYSSASSTSSSQGPTSLPVSISTSVESSATSTKIPTSTTAVPTTALSLSASSAPATPKSTSSVVLKSVSGISTTSNPGVTSSTSAAGGNVSPSPASGAKGLEMGFETLGVAVLCVVGFVAGLL